MLESLSIRNLALVKELEIEFGPGFNVVSGETGAGKSLILGALQILLGDRTPKSVIRRGTDRCEIAAHLSLEGQPEPLRAGVHRVLDETGLPPCEDGLLLLRRVITPTTNRVYVNATPCTLSVLEDLGEMLVDIHGPDCSRSLLKPAYQMELLDNYADLAPLRAQCRGLHEQVVECADELAQMQSVVMSDGERELVEFQLRELEEADLKPGEDEELNRRYDLLANARTLIETASQCCTTLNEGPQAMGDQLAELLRLLGQLEDTDPQGTREFRERLETIAAQVQDLAADLSGYAESVEVDQEHLQATQDRLDLIHRMTRKYGGTIESALEYADTLRRRLDEVAGRDDRIRELRETHRQRTQDHLDLCSQLSAARAKTAKTLAPAIEDRLQRLGFLQSTFQVRMQPAEPGPSGGDRIEFCFSPNPGEEPLPLRHIASSGEIARTMLAIKTVLSAADSIPILVFDEVDANIGGRVANAVAEELAALGEHHQALCITHLPQIAAAGQRHFRVFKEVVDDRTETRMVPLDPAGREAELVRMLGGTDDSDAARGHAREMLLFTTEEPQAVS